jgi:uncharacterized protein YndB with AHSA1/START domain
MVTLTDSIEIKTTPEHVFNWLTNIKTGKDYQAWHPDHVDCRWTKGEPFQVGSVLYFEEYLHGEMHKLKFLCTKVVPNRLIEYKPSFPWSIFMPKSQFVMEPRGEKACVFTATISFRAGSLFKKLGKKRVEAVKQHMKEEGENLKKILER